MRIRIACFAVLALLAAPALADGLASCHVGDGTTFDYIPMSEPEVVNGALRWVDFEGLEMTTNLDCFVWYRHDDAAADVAVKDAPDTESIECRRFGDAIYRGEGFNVKYIDGVMSWTDAADGVLYWSTGHCISWAVR